MATAYRVGAITAGIDRPGIGEGGGMVVAAPGDPLIENIPARTE